MASIKFSHKACGGTQESFHHTTNSVISQSHLLLATKPNLFCDVIWKSNLRYQLDVRPDALTTEPSLTSLGKEKFPALLPWTEPYELRTGHRLSRIFWVYTITDIGTASDSIPCNQITYQLAKTGQDTNVHFAFSMYNLVTVSVWPGREAGFFEGGTEWLCVEWPDFLRMNAEQDSNIAALSKSFIYQPMHNRVALKEY